MKENVYITVKERYSGNPMRDMYYDFIDGVIWYAMSQVNRPDFYSGLAWGLLLASRTIALNHDISMKPYPWRHNGR